MMYVNVINSWHNLNMVITVNVIQGKTREVLSYVSYYINIGVPIKWKEIQAVKSKLTYLNLNYINVSVTFWCVIFINMFVVMTLLNMIFSFNLQFFETCIIC